MKILFVRPPRYLWPWNSESSSFWQPLGFASMTAVLRREGFEVEILDCLPLMMGWKSLKKELITREFDVLCCGDETASAIESIKLTEFIKKNKPEVITIGGGFFFPYLPKASLNLWNFDYLIKGEGEQTLLELVSFISRRKNVTSYLPNKNKVRLTNLEDISGLIFLKNKKMVVNKERELIDLEKLPIPAYDLLPMHLYGNKSSNHKDFSAIEHGRGCTGGCNFCSISHLFKVKGKCIYRTKSAKKCFEETKILVEKYGRKTLNWVDGTFNLDSEWSQEYFTLLDKNNIKINHTAWMRADCVVRDERLGIMKMMAKGGLVQAVVGMERLNKKDAISLNIYNKDYYICKEAFRILRKYKSIYTIATIIYGLPEDSKKELKQIKDYIYDSEVDFQFILPFTPYQTTPLWQDYKDNFRLEDFKSWNLHRSVMGTKYLTREELDRWFKGCLFSYLFHPTLLRRIFFEKDKRKRKIQKSLALKLFKGFIRGLKDMITGQKVLEYGKKPRWYDS